MRFPLRDVIPSRTRPLVTLTSVALSAAALLIMYPGPLTAGLILLHAVPLLVFGETVEDQLGPVRHFGLLAVAATTGGLLAGAPGLFPALAAVVIGAHLSLFPTSRILLTLWIQIIEIPSFFLMGCWLFTMVLLPEPLPVIAGMLLLGAASARLLRQPQHARWEHFDLLP
jgi:membrane associated rhomboid family serine protease